MGKKTGKAKAKKWNRFYCIECLRKFHPRQLDQGVNCPFCQIPARCNRAKVVASVVTRLRRLRGIEPPEPKDDYAEYLASDLWRAIRARVMARDDHHCLGCGDQADVVHHKSYDREVLRGLRDNDLVSLCYVCHRDIEFTVIDGRLVKNNLAKANAKLAAKIRLLDSVAP